jgi:glycosyltransferase involved in cell wall biosynthesis
VDLVVLSEVRWGYFRTRKQFLLSRFPERWRIFFAQPPVAGDANPWTPRRDGNVTYFTVPFVKPGTKNPLYNHFLDWAPGRGLNERIASQALESRLRNLGVEPKPVLLVSNIYCPRALSRLARKLVFYDFNDSPFQFPGVPDWARDCWRRTLDEVDALFVVSEHYRRWLKAETSKPVIKLSNGVELSHFTSPRPVPASLAALPRPLIGYVGLLSHFLDFEALEALRQNRRGGTLVLIGPATPATARDLGALASREGIALMGAKPYEELPAWMQALDVGVIPFRANDVFVQGINPNKVYQYLASGIPAVTTPVLDLEPNPPHLQFASDPAGMVAAVHMALDRPAPLEARRALARPHDWDMLAAQMLREIEDRVGSLA